ncbi:MAG: hypothetical protein P4L42_04835 [Desulfocapsaceae bacterium]|nr:hypothetical protein [Desulfocapsaceae bacterium]
MTWTTARNNAFEIRIDLEHPKRNVEFRLDSNADWAQTPFLTHKFYCGLDEDIAALICVEKWWDSQS